MTAAPRYTIASDQIKEALIESRGSLSDAAKFIVTKWQIPCSRQYVKDACDKRPELLGFYTDLRNEFVDKAETNIFDAVLAGDLRVSLTVVQTLGKDRGWTQKQEVEVVDTEGSIARIHEARERAKAARKASEAKVDPLGDDPSAGPVLGDIGGGPSNGEEAPQ